MSNSITRPDFFGVTFVADKTLVIALASTGLSVVFGFEILLSFGRT